MSYVTSQCCRDDVAPELLQISGGWKGPGAEERNCDGIEYSTGL